MLGSCSLDSDDSGSDYDSTELLGDDAMGNFGKPNREEPMQDAEAEAALKAYLPNLVATSFAILSRDYISNDSDSS
ncbi:hypothetical protein IW141_000251 [Coemansia sp. RSA 355]|nr:hypothetical protein IW141_000251 [Coemansia sp. RSA 355]